jgi:transposase InsO family protein
MVLLAHMATAMRRPSKGCIHHTDRGSQYRSHDYQKILRQQWVPGVDEWNGQLL